MRVLSVLLTAAMLTCGLVGHARGDEPPPVFDTRPYADAKKAAEADKKWFIVKATAEWCGPCKQMDATTWRDEKVVTWLKANAIVVAIDVDKEKKLAGELNIEAMPTMVAFKDGKEFDRTVGYASPEAFLAWCQGIAKGERLIEKTQKRAAKPKSGGAVDIDAKYDLARSLADSGKHEQAADEYVWLWDNMLKYQNSMYGVRLSFMAGDMKRLAEKSDAAKTKFIALRDRAAKTLDGEKVDRELLTDWVVLNEVVGDDKATLVWFDKVKNDPRWRPLVERESHHLRKLLTQEKRWADFPLLHPDPMAYLKHELAFQDMVRGGGRRPAPADGEGQRLEDEIQARLFRDSLAPLYAGLLAAKREDDATRYAEGVLKAAKSAGMIEALVSTALEAGQPRQIQLEWIDAAKSEKLAAVRAKLIQALDKSRQPAEPAGKDGKDPATK